MATKIPPPERVAAVGSRAAGAALSHVADQQAPGLIVNDASKPSSPVLNRPTAIAPPVASPPINPEAPAAPWARLPRNAVLVTVAVALSSRAIPPPMP